MCKKSENDHEVSGYSCQIYEMVWKTSAYFQHNLKHRFVTAPPYSFLLHSLFFLHNLWYIFDCLNQSRRLNINPERNRHTRPTLDLQNPNKKQTLDPTTVWQKEFEVKSVASKCAGESVSKKNKICWTTKNYPVSRCGILQCFMHLSRQGQP